ncbi:adenylate/guanylate cyclase domain-containing protein [uncultured Jatrophihabitans sp.]|uniref:adenylate/guanylate cyclase domain-containing protein n=1 Tax=uncultured Jatrophihabitans sp. TaxID=1610747 RepID=UPI0035CBBD49
MNAAAVVAIVVGAVALLLAAAAIVFLVLWRRTRRQLIALEDSLRPMPRAGALEKAGRVVRTVVTQAARVRDHGVTQLLSTSLEELVRWARTDRERIVKVADEDGRVTLFFSDIADSTALNERLGDEQWVRVLRDHDRVVRREIERRDGLVVKAIGDGFMAVFSHADPAVDAAVAVQQAMTGKRRRSPQLFVRIGLHTGTAVSTGDDYLGRNVALCARVAAYAEGGQVLVSEDTRAAAATTAVDFVAEGSVELRGISGPVELFSVVAGE